MNIYIIFPCHSIFCFIQKHLDGSLIYIFNLSINKKLISKIKLFFIYHPFMAEPRSQQPAVMARRDVPEGHLKGLAQTCHFTTKKLIILQDPVVGRVPKMNSSKSKR